MILFIHLSCRLVYNHLSNREHWGEFRQVVDKSEQSISERHVSRRVVQLLVAVVRNLNVVVLKM